MENIQHSKLTEAPALVLHERMRQKEMWGTGFTNSLLERLAILGEEFGELCEAVTETECKQAIHPERGGFNNIKTEAVQVAAVAVSIIEQIMHMEG